MWSCLYITDRGAEEYESYGSIVDPQSGICDFCDRWIFGSASEFEPITDYGILKERFCALATDGIRAKILEEQGYDTQILEFIDMEHTPKNLLIRALHRKKPSAKGRVLNIYSRYHPNSYGIVKLLLNYHKHLSLCVTGRLRYLLLMLK